MESVEDKRDGRTDGRGIMGSEPSEEIVIETMEQRWGTRR